MRAPARRARRRILIALGLVLALQGVAALAYLALAETSNAPLRDVRELQGVERRSIAGVSVANRSEQEILAPSARPLLLHLWASWCAPCREELPRLVSATQEMEGAGLRVVLLSVDESWEVIEHYFADAAPANVRRMTHDEARRQLDLSTMPVTYIVDRQGVLTHVLNGAQPWHSPVARREVLALSNVSKPP